MNLRDRVEKQIEEARKELAKKGVITKFINLRIEH